MTLESALHARWAADAELNALLPAENLKTGLVRGAGMPCARLMRKACRAALSTNSAESFDEVRLEFRIWHDDYDAGRAIADAAVAAFDRSRFDISPTERVLHLRRTSNFAQQQDDGPWEFTLEFLAGVHRTGS